MRPQSHEHTTAISNRRRALFPCDDSVHDNDLSPLEIDSDSDSGLGTNRFSHLRTIGDYDIIGVVGSVTKAPDNNTNPVLDSIKNHTFEETPKSDSAATTKLPKLTRKTSSDCLFPALDNTPIQDTSPAQSGAVHSKNSKVRTALFPDPDMSLPPKSFYPKTTKTTSPRLPVPQTKTRKSSGKKPVLYLCNRRSNRFGQINAGVRHKIRKPKSTKKKLNALALQAALNILENSPLNDYLAPNEVPVNQIQPPVNNSAPELTPEHRESSPEVEPDPNKKFFKSSRHKGVVTINKNLKLQVSTGKMSLISKGNGVKRLRSETNDFEVKAKRPKVREDVDDEPLIPNDQIDTLLELLDDKENHIEPPANSANQENSILMSPTSLMCNMASGLALNSPKKAINLTPVLEQISSGGDKLFPVFYPRKVAVPERKKQDGCHNTAKRFRALDKDQMLLDAGQKKFGATQCPECKVIYHQGDPGDEIMHLNYHNAGNAFRYTGWKNERLVFNDLDSKIILIAPGDSKVWWKKVHDLLNVINRDLGFFEVELNTDNSQIFLYVKHKTIVGCLVAEMKTVAHRLLTTHLDQVDMCSEESYPVKCGVSRIWVSPTYRKKGVATALMNSLKKNFIYGHILQNEDIAFSSPTEMGKLFGRGYFKTASFLIYFA